MSGATEPDRSPMTPGELSPLPRSRGQRVLNWWFRSRRTGRITIVQFPNVRLWLFFATVGLRLVVPPDATARTVIDLIGAFALAAWALDELIRGVNPWRRVLGAVGCVSVAMVAASLG